MKRIIKYYLFFEKLTLMTVLSLIIVFLMTSLLVFLMLVITNLHYVGSDVYNYFTIRESQTKHCESLAETNTKVYWKDETFLGFGPDGSYGCFMMEDEEAEK